jgi:hypothetical protein
MKFGVLVNDGSLQEVDLGVMGRRHSRGLQLRAGGWAATFSPTDL